MSRGSSCGRGRSLELGTHYGDSYCALLPGRRRAASCRRPPTRSTPGWAMRRRAIRPRRAARPARAPRPALRRILASSCSRPSTRPCVASPTERSTCCTSTAATATTTSGTTSTRGCRSSPPAARCCCTTRRAGRTTSASGGSSTSCDSGIRLLRVPAQQRAGARRAGLGSAGRAPRVDTARRGRARGVPHALRDARQPRADRRARRSEATPPAARRSPDSDLAAASLRSRRAST